MRFYRLLTGLILISLLNGCASLPLSRSTPLATPLPKEYLPTAIALTLQAKGVNLATSTRPAPLPTVVTLTSTPPLAPSMASPTVTIQPSLTFTPIPTPTLAATSTISTTVPLSVTAVAQLGATPFPEIPDARVQIYKIGELSMVTSPFLVTSRLTSKVGKVVRVELYGEDGKLLARELKVFYTLPWHVANVSMLLNFEINGVAEMGRLVISAEDIDNRIIDLNSVNIVLLSTGETELNPASALQEAIVIQEPTPKALITGGTVFVSGLARPDNDQPLRVLLVAKDGRVLGQRLAGVTIPVPGGYGTFLAEVPYTVSEVTQVLLQVYEEGQPISPMTHLSSIDILLSP